MCILKYSKPYVFRKEPAGGILFNVDTGDIRIVEGVAFGICMLIETGRTESQILNRLKEEYPKQHDLETDLHDFICELREKGIVE
jgi:hypothetical protein